MKMIDVRPGMLIRSKSPLCPDALIVTGNYGARLTAIRTQDVTNPDEWEIVDPKTGTVEPLEPNEPERLWPPQPRKR
jgi:hypothetical protein